LYGSEVIVWNKSELLSLSYSFNSAMCKVYKIDFHSLSTGTVYYYTGQSDIADDVFKSQKTFLYKCGFVINSTVKLLAERRCYRHCFLGLLIVLCLSVFYRLCMVCLFVCLSLCVCYQNILMNKG